MATATQTVLNDARNSGQPYGGLITDDRSLSAELLYYMRGEPTPLRAWRLIGAKPGDHYQLTRPYKGVVKEPILLVARKKKVERITRHFSNVKLILQRDIRAGFGKPRRIRYYKMSGFKSALTGGGSTN